MDKKHKILIVDDDTLNIEILEEILAEQYVTKSVQTGEKALSILSDFNPDLILLDIMMPGMDGYEVCRKIRENERYKFIKIILVSGKSLVEERLQGYGAGADDYITKPFDDQELEAKVMVFLRLKHVEELDRIRGDLLKVFSHETRTPLNGILLSSEILMDDETLDENKREYVKVINESGHRLLDFVKKTSLLCDLKSGINIRKTCESLESHIKTAILSFDDEIKAKKLKLNLEYKKPDKIELCADWELMFKCLCYIIENAIKYSPIEGVVTITVDYDETKKGYIVEILDHGKGIASDWIKNIFNEFAIQDVLHHQKGLGLSLAICRHILTHHAGSIDAQSEIGKWTKFTLNIPEK